MLPDTFPAITRRGTALALIALAVAPFSFTSHAAQMSADEVAKRFDFLSKNGNSSCSGNFLASIPAMPDSTRLQGSCCGPMALHRYREQIEGLKDFSHIAEIPRDPYDIEAGLAKQLLAAYDIKLTDGQQRAYDAAMVQSSEKGPCCCPCWRWNVYGGLGKLLIRDHGFDGNGVARIWDLSHGCGGDAHMH
jgi:hypothetical protein